MIQNESAVPRNGEGFIELHVDLSVDPSNEEALVANFANLFRPVVSRQPGFKDVKLLKLRSALAGVPPRAANYRFVLTFESEDLRQKWIASQAHQDAWPAIANTLASDQLTILLYDASGCNAV
jgi:heme-degrading monooxygenase HmoA